MRSFELWETRSGNLMGSYETKEGALAVIAHAIRSHGPEYVVTIALMSEDSRGRSKLVAEGAALADLAGAAEGAGSPSRNANKHA